MNNNTSTSALPASWTLTYYPLHTPQPGYYHRGEGICFGAEDGGKPGLFDDAEDALSSYLQFLGEAGATVLDVTESGGYVGWGIVLSVTLDEDTTLYSVDIENPLDKAIKGAKLSGRPAAVIAI